MLENMVLIITYILLIMLCTKCAFTRVHTTTILLMRVLILFIFTS